MNNNDINGIIILNKPKGFTSFDCVNKVKHLFQVKKAGHTGTLDPNATGVLPICLGKATKASSMILEGTKVYKAEIIFGLETDTYDITGNFILDNRASLDIHDLKLMEVIAGFVGEMDQIPPIYSAKKVNGKKLYEYAREGKDIEIKPSRIRIDSIDLISYNGKSAFIRVCCSKGTYIRSLIHDIGISLGCHAAMGDLVREKTGNFSIEDAITLDELKDNVFDTENGKLISDSLIKKIIPVSHAFSYQSLIVRDGYEKYALNGITLYKEDLVDILDINEKENFYKIFLSDGFFVGIYKKENDVFVPYKMFLIKEN